ncbi:hypothetical protein DZB84_20540 [Bacillus sp. HNG]|nr:hypothetical protein DZB84_20540 [Bacillus sp. HNG]
MLKKRLLLIVILLSLIPLDVRARTELPYLKPKCPETEMIVKTSLNSKEQFLERLNELIPIAYPDDLYNTWNYIQISTLPSLIGVDYDEAYYKMAKNLSVKKSLIIHGL